MESVRHWSSWHHYGAENPTPVFLLQSAVVGRRRIPGIGGAAQPSAGCGRAIAACTPSGSGCPPSSCPTRWAMWWTRHEPFGVRVCPGREPLGRIIALHPAGLGAELARQAALVQALRRGTPRPKNKTNRRPRPHGYHRRVPGSPAPPLARRLICSPCAQSWARSRPAKRWWQLPLWSRWGSMHRSGKRRGEVLGAGADSRKTLPMPPS